MMKQLVQSLSWRTLPLALALAAIAATTSGSTLHAATGYFTSNVTLLQGTDGAIIVDTGTDPIVCGGDAIEIQQPAESH